MARLKSAVNHPQMVSFVRTPAQVAQMLERKERRQLFVILALAIAVSLLETAGAVSVMPLIAMIVDPKIIQANGFLNRSFHFLGFTSNRSFIFFVGYAMIALNLVRSASVLILNFAQNHFWRSASAKLSTRVLLRHLMSPYQVLTKTNSSTLYRQLSMDATLALGALNQSIVMLTEMVLAAFLLTVLFGVAPKTSTVAGLIMAMLVLFFDRVISKRTRRLGKIAHDQAGAFIQSATEVMGAMKDIKVLQKENFFIQYYDRHAKNSGKSLAMLDFMETLPRPSIESVALCCLISLILIKFSTAQNPAGSLSTIALFAAAGYKLMPSGSRILSARLAIQRSMPAVDQLFQLMKSPAAIMTTTQAPQPSIPFQKEISLENLSFDYVPGQTVLKDLNLNIPKGKVIGILGTSGAGKSTLVDLILGLLTPIAGQIKIDHQPLPPGVHSQLFGYVQQTLFLLEDSIEKNIAFGIPPEQMDHVRVKKAAQMAQLSDWIESLPEKYQSNVGEKGSKLSGGQRQRLGIARALYNDPPVLVLDEATSALDQKTEADLLAALETLKGQKTMIVITHRTSTLEICDEVYSLSGGKLHKEAKV